MNELLVRNVSNENLTDVMAFGQLLENLGYQVWLRHGDGKSWLFAQRFVFRMFKREGGEKAHER